ncbi:hypothetical protein G5V59_02390 [Nocardioides sp. W3-2-3]|uniref:hypothetical protein n=1 Tax=Nocardioides convexus TaxID=2712224 RepID=UPI0024187D25|nr:hypothetical protein [Nocardioides convexus]NGZ99603.1 hypothetical protein [Nocardioides convexus]
MAKNATSDLAHDLRDVADDLKEIVETVVAPRVTSAARAAAERGSAAVHAAAERAPDVVQAAADRVPDSVVDRLPDRVTDRLPVQKSHRGRKAAAPRRPAGRRWRSVLRAAPLPGRRRLPLRTHRIGERHPVVPAPGGRARRHRGPAG